MCAETRTICADDFEDRRRDTRYLERICSGLLPRQRKCPKQRTKTSLSTVEITISFPPWIRSYLLDILFCPGNTCTLLQTGDEKCCVGDTRVLCSTLRLYGRKSY